MRVLPFMKIVAGSRGELEGFTCGPSKIGRLSEKLEQSFDDQISAIDML